MNNITDNIKIGTIGEILVQLRLLENGIQAAPPIKDSGNDLIAIRGESFRAIQVKTTSGDKFDKSNLDRLFHVLAVVHLVDDDKMIYLDKSSVFLIPKKQITTISNKIVDLKEFRITPELINNLWKDPCF